MIDQGKAPNTLLLFAVGALMLCVIGVVIAVVATCYAVERAIPTDPVEGESK